MASEATHATVITVQLYDKSRLKCKPPERASLGIVTIRVGDVLNLTDTYAQNSMPSVWTPVERVLTTRNTEMLDRLRLNPLHEDHSTRGRLRVLLWTSAAHAIPLSTPSTSYSQDQRSFLAESAVRPALHDTMHQHNTPAPSIASSHGPSHGRLSRQERSSDTTASISLYVTAPSSPIVLDSASPSAQPEARTPAWPSQIALTRPGHAVHATTFLSRLQTSESSRSALSISRARLPAADDDYLAVEENADRPADPLRLRVDLFDGGRVDVIVLSGAVQDYGATAHILTGQMQDAARTLVALKVFRAPLSPADN